MGMAETEACNSHVCNADYMGVRPICPVCRKNMANLSLQERLTHVTGHKPIEKEQPSLRLESQRDL